MALFNKHPVPQQTDTRIRVNLKMLVDLARPAASLKKRRAVKQAQQSGGELSKFKGRGMEFDETRLYQPGDDIRSIDWRVTARTNKTHTKLFREERERPVFISVDYRPAMHFATRGVFKSVQAAKLAALLAWTAQHHGDRVGGQIFSDYTCHELKPRNGKYAVLRLFNKLIASQDSTPANEPISFERVMLRLTQHVRPGSLAYIISDFRELNSKVEMHLAKIAQHCDVVLIQIYDPLESHLPSTGRYRFTDKQRDVIFDTSDRQRLQHYQQRFLHRQQQLKKLSKKLHMAFIQCCTTDDPLQILR
jgi:uncharacterized protein (DUF58 family)